MAEEQNEDKTTDEDAPGTEEGADENGKNQDEDDGLTEFQKEASSHGWTSLEEYVDKGGDADQYVGAGAFLKNHRAIERDRTQKAEISGLKASVDKLAVTSAATMMAQRDGFRKELEAARAEARTDEDFEKFEEASEELKKLDALEEAPDEPATPEKPQVMTDFITEHPELDDGNADYDPILAGAINAFITQEAKELGRVLAKQPPTDYEMKTILNKAFEAADAKMNGNEQPKGRRKGLKLNGGKRPGTKTVKLGKAAQELYDSFKEQGHDDAAEDFKKRMTEAA